MGAGFIKLVNPMSKYKNLSENDKYEMFWPKGTKVRRLNGSSAFDINAVYELSKDKKRDTNTVCILKIKDGRMNTLWVTEYFELVSLPGETPEINNNYPIY